MPLTRAHVRPSRRIHHLEESPVELVRLRVVTMVNGRTRRGDARKKTADGATFFGGAIGSDEVCVFLRTKKTNLLIIRR